MTHDLPPGFQRISGTRAPPDRGQRYFIQLRQGFADLRVNYAVKDLVWKHGNHAGDVVAVKRAD